MCGNEGERWSVGEVRWGFVIVAGVPQSRVLLPAAVDDLESLCALLEGALASVVCKVAPEVLARFLAPIVSSMCG